MGDDEPDVIVIPVTTVGSLNAYPAEEPIADNDNEDDSQAALIAAMQADEYLFDLDAQMDGDHASALASAGWGMDEDYGPTTGEFDE
jgi:hypothetical protein